MINTKEDREILKQKIKSLKNKRSKHRSWYLSKVPTAYAIVKKKIYEVNLGI